MSLYEKSIVASGHQLVSEAAGEILKEGGNAFDGVVAAGFASAVAEPALNSLGGGGLLVGHLAGERRDFFFDFFVDTPGRGRRGDADLDFFPVQVEFSGSTQDFNVGYGSVAVPGVLKGLLHTHAELGKMPLQDVLRPARALAAGHRLNEQQAHFLQLLQPIMTLTPGARKIFEPDGRYLQAGDELCNPEMVEFFDQLVKEGDDCFYRGDIAKLIDKEMQDRGGLLTAEDLAAFEVVERPPLAVPFRNRTFVTSPEPSMGGPLIGLSLSLLGLQQCCPAGWGSGEHLCNSLGLMREVERQRGLGVTHPDALFAFTQDRERLDKSVREIRLFSRGTTHISIADKDGNCASMTCSNGEGSGFVVPGTGVMLNNMMGEDDLHPEGFHSSPPGQRVFSMMSPSLLKKGDAVELVIGSGGSKRIRTAISQVIAQVVDFKRSLRDAVNAPRLYLDEEILQIEPGFPANSIDAVKKLIPVNVWPREDVYFGGVHAVCPGQEGAGDPRRGGAVVVVT